MKNSTTIITTTLIVLLMASFHSYQPINGTSITPDTEFYYDGGVTINSSIPFPGMENSPRTITSNSTHILTIFTNGLTRFIDLINQDVTDGNNFSPYENKNDIFTIYNNKILRFDTTTIYQYHLNNLTIHKQLSHNLSIFTEYPFIDVANDKIYIFDNFNYNLLILDTSNFTLIKTINLESSSIEFGSMSVNNENVYFSTNRDFEAKIIKYSLNTGKVIGLYDFIDIYEDESYDRYYSPILQKGNLLYTIAEKNDIMVLVTLNMNELPDIMLTPIEDATTKKNDEGRYGTRTYLEVGTIHKTFLKFSLENITDISSAFLSLYFRFDVIDTYHVYGIEDDTWTELNISGLHEPAQLNLFISNELYSKGWLNFNVTQFITDQKDGYASFAILGEEYNSFYSRESDQNYLKPIIQINGNYHPNKYPINPIISTSTNTVTQTETNTVTQTEITNTVTQTSTNTVTQTEINAVTTTETTVWDEYEIETIYTTEISLSEVIVTNFKSEVNSPSLFLIIISLTSLFILKTQNRLHRR